MVYRTTERTDKELIYAWVLARAHQVEPSIPLIVITPQDCVRLQMLIENLDENQHRQFTSLLTDILCGQFPEFSSIIENEEEGYFAELNNDKFSVTRKARDKDGNLHEQLVFVTKVQPGDIQNEEEITEWWVESTSMQLYPPGTRNSVEKNTDNGANSQENLPINDEDSKTNLLSVAENNTINSSVENTILNCGVPSWFFVRKLKRRMLKRTTFRPIAKLITSAARRYKKTRDSPCFHDSYAGPRTW